MSNIEEMFAGMETAKQMHAGQHFKGEGNFELLTKSMKTNEGNKGKFFIAEFEVLKSTSPQDPVGCTRSWAIPLTGEKSKYSFGDIKSLVFAICGTDPKSVPPPEVDPGSHNEAKALVCAACDPEYAKAKNIDTSLLIGQRVNLQTWFKPTKPKPIPQPDGTFIMKPGVFTKHDYSPAAQAEEGAAQ